MATKKRSDNQYQNLDEKQYQELVKLRYVSFRNLSRKNYQKLKSSLELAALCRKQVTELGSDVIGFLFREILRELVELVLVHVLAKGSGEMSASEIFEACRRYTFHLVEPALFVKAKKRATKCSFF